MFMIESVFGFVSPFYLTSEIGHTASCQASVAQLVERVLRKHKVHGSNPCRGTDHLFSTPCHSPTLLEQEQFLLDIFFPGFSTNDRPPSFAGPFPLPNNGNQGQQPCLYTFNRDLWSMGWLVGWCDYAVSRGKHHFLPQALFISKRRNGSPSGSRRCRGTTLRNTSQARTPCLFYLTKVPDW